VMAARGQRWMASIDLARGGLAGPVQPWEALERSAAMAAFYARWQEKPVDP